MCYRGTGVTCNATLMYRDILSLGDRCFESEGFTSGQRGRVHKPQRGIGEGSDAVGVHSRQQRFVPQLMHLLMGEFGLHSWQVPRLEGDLTLVW